MTSADTTQVVLEVAETPSATPIEVSQVILEVAYTPSEGNAQSVDATTTLTAGLTAVKGVGQAVAATTTLTAGLATKKNAGQAVGATTSIGVALATAYRGRSADADAVSTLPSLKQRAYVGGAGTGYVAPVWTITLEAV